MRIGLFYHSLVSDWNNGNAHFLRGVATELQARGHEVRVFEPRNAWSRYNLLKEHGPGALRDFRKVYPHISSRTYTQRKLELMLEGLDLVLVHEWNEHEVVKRIGLHRKRMRTFKLFFHDTHHRSVTNPRSMSRYNLSNYDGVLAFGEAIRRIYIKKRWARRVWTWHEAADTRVFHPIEGARRTGDLVWIGNWGDGERTAELQKFLLEPVKALRLRASVYGVRYPTRAKNTLMRAGISYRGWLPNYRAPNVFARFRVTIHIPRRPYKKALPGIPTIRPFEALACGIPLICSPWKDSEYLFTTGQDFLIARNGKEMKQHLKLLLNEPDFAREQAAHGLKTIRERHTCIHRVDELLSICSELGLSPQRMASGNGEVAPASDALEMIPPEIRARYARMSRSNLVVRKIR